jgi:hypothetical protein
VTGGFIARLAAAEIGATCNFYRGVVVVAEAPGYRGTRVSGIPLTSERQLTGSGPPEAPAHGGSVAFRSGLAELLS